jgi:chromosomal replication initiation ATPase DnaA
MHPYIYIGLNERQRHLYRIDNITNTEMIEKISNHLGISLTKLMSKSRQRDICEARHICIGLISKFDTNITLKTLGALFCKHHATIIHCRRTYENLYETDKNFKIKVTNVINSLQQK